MGKRGKGYFSGTGDWRTLRLAAAKSLCMGSFI